MLLEELIGACTAFVDNEEQYSTNAKLALGLRIDGFLMSSVCCGGVETV